MRPCLRPEEFIDALDGCAASDAAAHVATCPQCHATLAEMHAALAATRSAADVPEPSPLFWTHVNARVGAAIGDEPHADLQAGWWAWLRWDIVVPLAGVAMVVVALASAVDRVPTTPGAPPLAEASMATDDTALVGAGFDAVTDHDGALELMVDLAATMPGGEWDALGLSVLPDLGVAAQSLSPDEQQALGVLLQAAVERPTS